MYLEYDKKVSNKGTRTYVKIKGSYRDGKQVKKIIYKNYGVLEDLIKENPNIKAEIEKDYQKFILEHGENRRSISINLKDVKNKRTTNQNLGYRFIERFYNNFKFLDFFKKNTKDLRIKYDVNNIFKYLVIAKMFKLGSKKRAFENIKTFYNSESFNFSEHDMYRSLSVFNKLKENMQVHLHEVLSKQIERDISVVFYDVTNYWFSIDDADNLEYDENGNLIDKLRRKRGVSKENRKNPIVQMGLFIDSEGIPIAYKLFDGNTNDQSTLIPSFKEIRNKFNLNKIVLVADKGLNSNKNLGFLIKNGSGFIVSRKIRGAKKEFRDWVLNQDDYTIINDNFKIKSEIVERTFIDENGNKFTKQMKIIAFHSVKYMYKENTARNEYLKQIIKELGKKKFKQITQKSGVRKYLNYDLFNDTTGEVEELNVNVSFDNQKINNDIKLDGYYVIETSETELSNDQIIEKYRSLWRIEDSFKVIKSDLEGRPVFVSTAEHIEAHFLICFVALFMTRIIQKTLGYKKAPTKPFIYSAKEIMTALKSLSVKQIDNDVYSVNDYNELMQLIASNQNIDINYTNMTKKIVEKI